MRITQNFSDRKYLKNSSRLLSGYTKSMLKIESQMDYFRASENAVKASKAMTVRKNLQDLSLYDSHLKLTKRLPSRIFIQLQTRSISMFPQNSIRLATALTIRHSLTLSHMSLTSMRTVL